MTTLIDLTDDAFKIPPNAAVMEYVRRESPFAHSNVGAHLVRLGRGTPGARYYCPDFRSYAYVALHTEAKVIFALAFGMRQIAFRLPPTARAEAVAEGATAYPAIGEQWVAIDAFAVAESPAAAASRLEHWCEVACRAAMEAG